MDNPGFLGRYQLKRILGRGAMGVVYEGWDERLNRKVAVKTILTSELLEPADAAEYSARFIREAQNAAQLIHPNIVTVFDFGNEAGMAYLVMELIQGKELKAYLDAGRVFSIREAVAIACQLLEALDYVHGKRIFHRDIKPANVMLEAGKRVRLTDFGVARFSAGAGEEGTVAGTVVGTPSYMAPEQIKGLPAGVGADLFATGVLLYQCLTLQKPFVGNSEWETWQKIVNDDPPPMSTYRDQIPEAIERAVLHALEKDPRDRPASARELIDELQDALEEVGFDAETTRLFAIGGPDGGRDDSGARTRTRTRGGAPLSSQGRDASATSRGSQRYPDGHDAQLPGRKPFPFLAKTLAIIGVAGLVLFQFAGGKLFSWSKQAPAEVGHPPAAAPAWQLTAQSVAPGGAASDVQGVDKKSRDVHPVEQSQAPTTAGDPKTRPITEQKKHEDEAKSHAVKDESPRKNKPAETRPEKLRGETVQGPKAEAVPKARNDDKPTDAVVVKAEENPNVEGSAPPAQQADRAGGTPEGGTFYSRAYDWERGRRGRDVPPTGKSSSVYGMDKPVYRDQIAPRSAAADEASRLFVEAQRAEREGRFRDAIAYYERAYAFGNADAARALGDLYGRGVLNDPVRDHDNLLRWYEKAKELGLAVPSPEQR